MVQDAVVSTAIKAGQEYQLTLSLNGGSVSASIKVVGQTANQAIAGYVFNASTVDGGFGVIATGGFASFDDIRVKTNDPVFIMVRSESMLAAAGQSASPSAKPVLTQSQLDAVTRAAIANWTKSLGNGAAALARLADIRFTIADLSAGQLGTTHGRLIQIDADAAGHGWFVDASPADNREFKLLKDGGMVATAASQAAGRMDLLSVVSHEIGHVLGFVHDDAAQSSVMQGSLDAGVRRLPSMIGEVSKKGMKQMVTQAPAPNSKRQ
jgi:predicted Zn-dependent protease